MLIEKYSRFFLRHDLRFRAQRDMGVPLKLVTDDDTLDVVTVLEKAVKAGKAKLTLRNLDVIRITDIEKRPKDKLLVLLFRRSDPEAAAPVFEDTKTLKLRRIKKAAHEAVTVSAHLFISLEEKTAANPTYAAALEEVPSLGRTYVQGIIRDILREEKYSYDDGKGKERETYTLIDFHGVKSETLHGALGASAIPYVELVRPGNVDGLDTEGLVVPRDERMKLLLKADKKKVVEMLNRIKVWAKGQNWKDVRVLVDMPDDRTKWVSIAREADAADILFVKSERVDVKNALDPCTDTINDELVQKAKKILFSK